MKIKLPKITAILFYLLSAFIAASGWCATSLTGSAELSYVKYDAAVNGNDLFSGSTFAQKYSVSYTATNRYYRNQRSYYNLMAGYDWINFTTNIAMPDEETKLTQSLGKLKYTGEFAYTATSVPVSFRVYLNDFSPYDLNRNAFPVDLLDSGLADRIDEYGKSVSSGFSLAFEPGTTINNNFRGLPKAYLDYNEVRNKNPDGFYPIDNKIRSLAVAGLNQENNWLNYRFTEYEDFIQPHGNFTRQQFQLGHVDNRGRRKWAALTNWIDVSTDASLTTMRSTESYEEYDVSLMAKTGRRAWEARTFMNYNRIQQLYASSSETELTTTARIPVYIKGVYGPDTNWHMSVSAERATRNIYSTPVNKQVAYVNTISLGATTFKHSPFNLSPSFTATTSKDFGGTDALGLLAAVETNSSARYSRTASLAARLEMRYHDNGYDAPDSQTWFSTLSLQLNYKPDSKIYYSFSENLQVAEDVPDKQIAGYSGTEKYLQSATIASLTWLPTSTFSTTLEASYRLRKNELNADRYEAGLNHRLSYEYKVARCRLDTRIRQSSDYYGKSLGISSSGSFEYRPNRNNDAMLRYTYSESQRNTNSTSNYSSMDLVQTYKYNFFTSSGVMRNFATLSQEAGYVHNDNTQDNGGRKTTKFSTLYLQLLGRYSPTERFSLYGSTRYAKSADGAVAMYYNAGINADFKLLSTSLDYKYATRDSDNKVEKKLTATVRRTF